LQVDLKPVDLGEIPEPTVKVRMKEGSLPEVYLEG